MSRLNEELTSISWWFEDAVLLAILYLHNMLCFTAVEISRRLLHFWRSKIQSNNLSCPQFSLLHWICPPWLPFQQDISHDDIFILASPVCSSSAAEIAFILVAKVKWSRCCPLRLKYGTISSSFILSDYCALCLVKPEFSKDTGDKIGRKVQQLRMQTKGAERHILKEWFEQ